MIRNLILYATCCTLTLSSCGYAGAGALLGSQIGERVGSSIGAINSGWRGSAVGSLVGMGVGAVVGAGIGGAVDASQAKKEQAYREQAYQDEAYQHHGGQSYGYERPASEDRGNYARQYTRQEPQDSGFDPTGGGDDRIDFEAAGNDTPSIYIGGNTTVPATDTNPSVMASQLPGFSVAARQTIEIRNAAFTDADGNGIITPGEQCTISFDVMNRSRETVFDIVPVVMETTANRFITVSPSVNVESIAPGAGIRYTATILASKKLKPADLVFHVAVAKGGQDIASTVKEFKVKAEKIKN